MDNMLITNWIFGVVMVAVSLFFLVVGLQVLIKKRPILFSARWLFWIMVLAYLPALIIPVQTFFDIQSGPVDTTLLLVPLIFVVILILFWVQTAGYIVYGITDDSFHSALKSTLERLNLSHEEMLSRIRLPKLGADIQISVQSWMGTAAFRIKPTGHASTLNDIASGMKEYLAKESVQTNRLLPLIYVLLGVLLVVFTVVIIHSMATLN